MRFVLITFLILMCCTTGEAWASETITEEEHTRTFDQGMDRFQEALELLKKNAEQNRKVEQTLAKIRAAWGADLKQAPVEVEAPAREHNREIEQSLAKIRAVLQSDFKQASEELEIPDREHNRKVEQTLAIIMAAWQADLKQAPEELETPVPVAKNQGQGINSILDETSTESPSYKKLILYRSPNDYVLVKPFFKKSAGISFRVKW